MPDLAHRKPLTPETARATPLRTLLDRVDAFTTAFPRFTISAPYSNSSGLWEVSSPDGTASWDNGRRMMDELEKRYLA